MAHLGENRVAQGKLSSFTSILYYTKIALVALASVYE